MLRFIQNLDPDKFEHIVVCPYNEKGIREELKECSNCKIVFMNLRSLKANTFFKLLRLLKLEDISLIHSHGKAAGIYGRVISRISGIAVAHHLHGIHYRQYGNILQVTYLQLERLLSRWSQRVICVSGSEKEEGLALQLFDSDKAIVVSNGVNTKEFSPQRHLKSPLKDHWNIPKGAQVIISITRYCYQKNPELTLAIHAEVCKHKPNTYLLMIGIDPENEELSILAEKLKIRKQVLFIKGLSDLHQLLNLGDVYLSSSRWEGLSLGIIEAMAVGLPVVLSNVVGNAEIQKKGGEGVYYVSEESPSTYAKIIVNLLDDEQLSLKSGMQARDHVIRTFNLDHTVKKMEKEYCNVINGFK